MKVMTKQMINHLYNINIRLEKHDNPKKKFKQNVIFT